MNQIQELAELRATVADLAEQIAQLSVQVVTRRLVVVDGSGAERIIGEVIGQDALLSVQTDIDHRASLLACTSGCCPLVGLSVQSGDDFPVQSFNECHDLRVAS